MKQAKQCCIYCPPEVWERIRRRAKKRKMKISRFVWLCCQRAAEGGSAAPPEPTGHPLVLTENEQRCLYEGALRLSRSGCFAVRAPGGGEAVVTIHKEARFLRLAEQEVEA